MQRARTDAEHAAGTLESEEYTAFTAYLLPVLKVTNNINSGKYPGKTVVRPYSLGTPSKPCGRRRGARELACLV